MKKESGFSLAEMMVLLLIIAVTAAASAPLINKRLHGIAGNELPWTKVSANNIAFNYKGADATVTIGAVNPPAGPKPKLYLNRLSDSNGRLYNHILFTTADDKIARISASNTMFNASNATETAGAFKLGTNRNIVSGSVVLGRGVNASNQRAVHLGNSSTTRVPGSIALGSGINGRAIQGFADGDNAPIMIGYASMTSAQGAISIGDSANVSAPQGISIGQSANTRLLSVEYPPSATSPIAIGTSSNSASAESISIGTSSQAFPNCAISIGTNSRINSRVFNNITNDASIKIGSSTDGIENEDETERINTFRSSEFSTVVGYNVDNSNNDNSFLGSYIKNYISLPASERDRRYMALYKNLPYITRSGVPKYRSESAVTGRTTNNPNDTVIVGSNSGDCMYQESYTGFFGDTGYIRHALMQGPRAVSVGAHTYTAGEGVAIGYNAQAYAGAISLGSKARCVINYTRINRGANLDKARLSTVIGYNTLLREPNSTFIGRDINGGSLDSLGNDTGATYIRGNVNIPGTLRARGRFTDSDIRLKNVGSAFTSGLSELLKLEPYHYTFKQDKKKTPRVGVIAQDLQKIFPDAVLNGDDGFLQIRYEDMFYTIVNAIKELDAKIILQNKRMDVIAKNNANSYKRLAKIEKRIAKLEKKELKANKKRLKNEDK